MVDHPAKEAGILPDCTGFFCAAAGK